MSTTFKTRAGDTFDSIARRAYGSEQYASMISTANPGVSEPLAPGTELLAPSLPSAPSDKQTQGPANTENEVAVLIARKRFRFWTDMSLVRSLDAMDTVELSAPFNPTDADTVDTFRPFTFKDLNVTVGGAPLFSGTMIGVNPAVTPTQKTISASGYSRPGVLNDCTPPPSAYPVEFNNLALPEIAKALCDPFGLAVEFADEGGSAFERVAIDPGATVLSFLSDLARQRSLVVSSTPAGAVLFQKSVTPGRPVASLLEGASPVVSVTPFFSPQEYFSHITGLEPVLVGTEGSQYTVKNPHLAGALRPMTFKAGDVQGGDLKQAVEAKAGRMYGNMASYSLAVSTWRDPRGNLWEPNTTIRLQAPGAMIYQFYEFVIRSVRFDKNSRSESAQLNLVVPGSFSGETPEALPWD